MVDAEKNRFDGKVTHVTLVVANQAKALEFYTERVGFEKKADIPAPPGGSRWVTVGPRGQDLEISLWEKGTSVDPSQKDRSKDWAAGRAPPIVMAVADCQKTYQALRANGVEFPKTPEENPWATSAVFQDPDGNLFQINQFRRAGPGPS